MEVVVADLAEALAELGQDVTVFAPDGSELKGCKVEGFGLPVNSVDADWYEAERNAYENYKDKLDGFDIIHGHNWLGFEYLVKAGHQAYRVCHTHHGGISPNAWWKMNPKRNPFKLNLIVVSQWTALAYFLKGFSVKYVYNGVNLKRYPYCAEKGERLLFVGRFDRFKQPHVAIEVAKKTGLGLDLVGGSFVRDQAYLEKVKDMCDGEQIRIHFDAPHERKVEFMQRARVLVFPSKMLEAFGLVAVEAMACGTPVIGANDGAIPEVVQEGGVICNTVDEMVDAVGQIGKISPKMCRRNAEKFSRETMAVGYTKLYKMIVEGVEW